MKNKADDLKATLKEVEAHLRFYQSQKRDLLEALAWELAPIKPLTKISYKHGKDLRTGEVASVRFSWEGTHDNFVYRVKVIKKDGTFGKLVEVSSWSDPQPLEKGVDNG